MLSANAAAPRTRPRICIPRPVIEPSCPDRRCGLDLIGTPNGRKRKALVRVNAPHAAPVVQLCGKPDQRSPERHQALSSEGGMSDRANANTMSSLGGRRCQNGRARSFSLFRNTCGFRAAAAPLTLTKRMLSASTPLRVLLLEDRSGPTPLMLAWRNPRTRGNAATARSCLPLSDDMVKRDRT